MQIQTRTRTRTTQKLVEEVVLQAALSEQIAAKVTLNPVPSAGKSSLDFTIEG